MAVARMISGLGFWLVARILLGLAAEYTLRRAYLREVNDSPNVQVRSEQIGRIDDIDLPATGFDPSFKLKPDILDKDLKTYYEIKSTIPLSITLGLNQLDKYGDALALRFPTDVYSRGLWTPLQAQYQLEIPGWFKDFPLPLYVRAYRHVPGLIVYSEWDVQRYALLAGLIGLIAPDIIRTIGRYVRPGGGSPDIIPFPQPQPGIPVPLRPVAAIGGLSLFGGLGGLGGF